VSLVDRRAASVLFTVVGAAGTLVMIYQARRPLISFIFAILFAYLLDPFVSRVQKCFRGSRGLAVAATYLLLGAVLLIFGITAGPRIVKEGEVLVRQLPALMENVGSGLIAQQVGKQNGWDFQTRLQVQLFLRSHRATVTRYTQAVVDYAAGLAANVMWLLLIPILAAFLLKDSSRMADAFPRLIEEHPRRRVFLLLLSELDAMLATFIRAQLWFTALGLVAYTSFLLLAKFPYAFAVGATAGFLEFIPFVGPLISMVVIMGIAVGTGYPHCPAVLVFLLLWRLLQDYVTSPYLIGRGLNLHPLAVLLGVLVGGELGGVLGLFLSTPILAALRIVWSAWVSAS
jgi:predicted PurR-regulated permease PerM